MGCAVERILVPTDFSPASEVALSYALINFPTAHIRLLHVVNPVVPVIPGISPERFSPSSEDIVRAEKKARAQLMELSVQYRIPVALEIGAPASTIVRHAKATQCQMIVMSMHSQPDRPLLLMGSVSEDVFRGAGIPVLFVPDQVDHRHNELHA